MNDEVRGKSESGWWGQPDLGASDPDPSSIGPVLASIGDDREKTATRNTKVHEKEWSSVLRVSSRFFVAKM
jgi:hypothetical protein